MLPCPDVDDAVFWEDTRPDSSSSSTTAEHGEAFLSTSGMFFSLSQLYAIFSLNSIYFSLLVLMSCADLILHVIYQCMMNVN